MAIFSPAASYQAKLREELDSLGRILALQRVLTWGCRGLAMGLAIDLVVVAWTWYRESLSVSSGPVLLVPPLTLAMASGAGALLVRSQPQELARKMDSGAHLQERAVTALELGAREAEHPLALAQMRDALEHLQRVDALSVFPVRPPRFELVAAGLLVVVGLAIGFAPNPWALARARANNPAVTVARDQAQRVDRLAAALEAEALAEIQELSDLLRRGARTIETRSSMPDEALAELEQLEEQIRQRSAGDDQLASALAAISGALAGEEVTGQLARAINTGDLREIARASRGLAETSDQLGADERERAARALQEAAARAGRSSPRLQSQLGDAAAALRGGGGRAGEAAAPAGGDRSAQEAFNEMAGDASAAAERQRALGQVESSRNALERALGRSQSRSGSSQSASRGGSRERAQRGEADAGMGTAGEGAEGEQSGSGEGENGTGGGGEGREGAGSGFGGGSRDARPGSGVSDLDTMTRPEQLQSASGFAPDETSDNPFLGESGAGSSRLDEEAVSAGGLTGGSTRGGEGASIPLGLRDLVKDYFSALDQR